MNINIVYLHVYIIYVYMVRLKPKPKKYVLLRVRGGMEQGEEIGEVVGLLYYSSHFVDL